MDENRLKRLRELVDGIELAEDEKGLILENVKYRKKGKFNKYIKYAAAAAAAVVLVCLAAANTEFYKKGGDQNGLTVYASELNGEEWLALSEGERRQLSGTNETGWGYTFLVEIPEEVNYYYSQQPGVTIGVDWVYVEGNQVRWVVHDDSGFDFPEHMESSLVIYLADDNGNRTGRYRLILTKEEDACYVELINESYLYQ